MKKINLNIIGIKDFDSNDLDLILKELEKVDLGYSSLLYDPISKLKFKVRSEVGKRHRSKQVWVEFTSYWSGYSSNQRKMVGRFYRKLDKIIVDKMPKYYSHVFTDSTTNDWNIKVVDVRGRDEGSYSHQVDQFIKSFVVPPPKEEVK